jgi:hypothetical protein
MTERKDQPEGERAERVEGEQDAPVLSGQELPKYKPVQTTFRKGDPRGDRYVPEGLYDAYDLP